MFVFHCSLVPYFLYVVTCTVCFSACSLTLILVTDDDALNEAHSRCILDYVYNSMVLLYGADNLVNIKNIERFKKEIKVRL